MQLYDMSVNLSVALLLSFSCSWYSSLINCQLAQHCCPLILIAVRFITYYTYVFRILKLLSSKTADDCPLNFPNIVRNRSAFMLLCRAVITTAAVTKCE